MSRVMFITHDLYQDDNHFPLGTAYLAAVLEKDGHDVEVVSQDISHCSNSVICNRIRSDKPDIIGIGFLAARFRETVLPLCREINQVKGDAWLVLGGHGASGCPEYIAEATSCDRLICGEGEVTFPHTVLEKEGRVESLIFLSKYADSRGKYVDLDSLPFPAWHLFPVDEYKKQVKMPGWEMGDYTMSVTASRGCKGKCTFCQRLSKGLRFRSMESVVEEIAYLYKTYGINYIFFQDEMFVANEKRMIEFLGHLKRRNLLGKIKWGGDSRVEVINETMLEILKQTNCQFLDFGFESMDDKVLTLMRKGVTSEQNRVCAELTRKSGIPFNMNLLWGMPGDSVYSLRKNLKFINEFNTHHFLRTIRPPTPYPGCELFDQAVNGGVLGGPEDFFDRFTNSDRLTVNFTDLPDEEFYTHLYSANGELIRRYYEHKRHSLVRSFRKVYFENDNSFRGARHYA